MWASAPHTIAAPGIDLPTTWSAIHALVLPIFEGVKPILELKVICRSLLS